MKFSSWSAPCINASESRRKTMLDLIIALFPATLFGITIFGFRALLVIAVSVASAILSEALFCIILKKPLTVFDLSSAVTGLILALSLPPRIPLYMAALGSAFAVVAVKMLFGGAGKNLLNPAAAARAFMLISFGTAMSVYYEPFADTVAMATPLSGGAYTVRELFFGVCSGSVGETSAVMLLFGALYLAFKRVINPCVPLAFIFTSALISLIAGRDPLAELCSGGLLFGALFMATDPSTVPKTTLGKIFFGFGCGVFTMLFRLFGGMVEGVSFSIILMNFLVPAIEGLVAVIPFDIRFRKESRDA